MIIGILAEPEKHHDWPKIKAFLEPAAKRGRVPILEDNEAVWVVYDGPLIGAATARLTVDGFGEIVLVGGSGFRKWLAELDWMIGAWMRREGMKEARAYGRRGWKRFLQALGWDVIQERDGVVAYERKL